MITIVLITLLCILIWLIFDEYDFSSFLTSLLAGLSVGLLVATILGGSKLSDKEVKYVTTNTTYIVSINDGTHIYGRFILGSGTIEGVPCYVYYVGNEVEGYKIARIKAENVVIKEEHNCTPRIIYKGWKRTKPFYKSFFAIPRIIDEDEITIYVPKGTIIRSFVLDSNI